ncbi:Sortase A, LPXTG specific [Pediococcus damnosus]|uniref:Sortase A, LPXTG specific n=1 Tax=Pediococcus damnosus TaxID=51663 RepID=A0A0R2HKP6_9LACO|nr:class A sortase [Pediococcus damnosus]AMV60184.1 Sortase A, LPXTG specific [Pediococcus damnosus]AMV62704.1 Sortase A, LPXTG specific [Pediococcus damnosus]AMV64429.1 Sortase A, LPXTG specific [Pediococcus damnosus]AMV67411.1 Sortase A, LPXTG specific [Pediococcus damnosus]AMV69709.1 Sortase A, LPXTG specific [Pediococcus damnosus]
MSKKSTSKKTSKFGRWLATILVFLLLLVSLALIFNAQIKDWLVDSYKPQVTQQSIAKNKKKKASYDFQSVKSLDFQTVAKARTNASKLDVVGEISIPKVKLNLQITNGITNENLALTAATLKANMKMGQGNYALAGHHMVRKDILFSPLYWKMRPGMMIYVTDLKRIYSYKATERKFIAATRVDVINNVPNKKLITLITCDATGANRLMIRGKYEGSVPYKKAPEKIQKGFTKNFNNK